MKTQYKDTSGFSARSGRRAGTAPLALLLASIMLALALAACGGQKVTLTYRAGGTAANATVTYIDGGGNQQEATISLPWETTIEISGETYEFQLTVVNTTSTGDIRCEILLNEEAMAEPASSQAYLDCSGEVSKSGNGWSYHISTHPVELDLNAAEELYDDGDYEAALAEVDKALQLAPNFANLYFMQGLVRDKMGDFEQALRAYTRAIELDAKYVEAYNNRGLVYEKVEDLDAAIADWMTALELDPASVKYYYNRSRAYFDQGNYAAAQADVLKVQELSQDPEMLAWVEGALEQLSNLPDENATTVAGEVAETPESEPPSAGQWVLFTSANNPQRVIYALNLDNGDLTPITPGTSYNWDAALSPDGKQIAFVSAQDGYPDIYVMKVDGSDLTHLTDDPAPDYTPAWSHDGSTIAFVSDRNGNADIYAVSANSASIVQITTDPAEDWSPTWNNDGTEIAFVSDRDGDAEIYIFNTNGSTRQLTENTHYDADPAWSPNGRFIAFSSSPGGVRSDIYIIRPDGTDLQSVTLGTAEDIQPTWSSDSNYLLFASNRDGSTMEIYMMDESSKTIRLTFNEVDDLFPAWGPLVTP